jgi:predicted Zn-dependent peptidase
MYEFAALDNGLRILTVTMPHLQSASLGFFLGVGSRYESEAMAGASHFVEHMLFKGTERRPSATELAEAIEGKGGVFNASTGLESTLYWAKVAAPHLLEALDVVSDMLLHATFPPTELEKERAVIGEEISYALDAPDSLSQILINQLQWPDHALGRDVAGTRESVASMSRESLLAHLADHYRPDHAILGVAGQVEHDQVVAWAKSNLAEWEPGSLRPWDPAPPNHRGPCLHVEYKETEQAHLSFSFAGMSRCDPDRFAGRLLNMILGEGMRSRLFQEVRERLGLAYCVDSYLSVLQDTGAVGIYAGVAASRAVDTSRAILDQLDRLRQDPISEEELEKTLEFARGRLALSLEDSFTTATWYARQYLLGPQVLTPEEIMARFEAVRPAEIQRLAQTLFQKEQLNLVVVGPYAQGTEWFHQAIQL